MNTLKIQNIEVRAFKAFEHLNFKLDGRHLLAYGGNGAGKSSLYWTLYTFLQSATKDTADVIKYFDVAGQENLLNLYSTDAARAQASIVVTLKDDEQNSDHVYKLAKELHDTKGVANIQKANLASDFITYRVLSSFYQFRNSQAIDLWPVFEQEILPFSQGTSTKDVAALWKKIQNPDPFFISKALGDSAWRRKQRYEEFDRNVARFNAALDEVLTRISTEAQKFYDKHFAEPGQLVELKVGLTTRTSNYQRKEHRFSLPKIGFEVQLNGKRLTKPQSFLNEAKLTQLALSVRFGATLAHFQESPLKLLVLDDLLISLDMNNRMKVVDIILGETFADYQKVILTHDSGFFEEFRRRIGGLQSDWSFQRFSKPNAETGITLKEDKSAIEKAEDYLNGQNLDEAASSIRKAAEATAARFRTGTVVATEDFVALTKQLNSAKKKLLEKIPFQLYEQVLKDLPHSIKQHLVPTTDVGLSVATGINAEQIEEIVKLRVKLNTVLSSSHWQMIENAKIVDEVLATTARVLNPGSHGGATPLYETEVRHAIELVKKLERCLI